MGTAKIAISIDSKLLKKIDYYVHRHIFKNRSQAIQSVVEGAIEKIEHRRLAEECAKLDIAEEQSLAEEGFAEDMDKWPKY